MTSNSKITYLPIYDLVLFLMALITLSTTYYMGEINVWLAIPLLVFLYTITIGRACIIRINNYNLNIIILNPFVESHLINIKSIIKINSHQTFDYESTASAEGYYSLNREYDIRYYDKDTKQKTVKFRINNQKKERKIFEILKSLSDHNGG